MSRCELPQLSPRHTHSEALTDHLRHTIEIHFHPTQGTPYWLDWAKAAGLDPLRKIQNIDDLSLMGNTTAEDLNSRPLTDFIPRRFHNRMHEFVVAQTGGTTGQGTWTAYRQDEFHDAFVRPFVIAAQHVSFPTHEQWLFVGPSGPHVIGKVVRHLAAAMDSAEPFSVDFDPRWAKRLPEGSFARSRYLQHVIDQAMAVIDSQDIGVLFTTPVILLNLAEAMNNRQRERIHAVHYGGMTVAPDLLLRFQKDLFPAAVHLSGYGNTLFGCCLELNVAPGRSLDYFPYGHRLLFELVGPDGSALPLGQEGQVLFTRLDESMLIVRYAERDAGTLLEPPPDAPEGFDLPGIRAPHPLATYGRPVAIGLY